MSEVVAVVEGPTEQTFVREVLAPWLGHQRVQLRAATVGKPGHKGGNVYAVAKRDMLSFLKQRADLFVTCFFDFYGMKYDWPQREAAEELFHDNKARAIETAILQDVQAEFGANWCDGRLIPHVQIYEFEALLFAYPVALSKALARREPEPEFQEIRNGFQTPEHINDDPNAAPSKRIIKVFHKYNRKYRKPLHGSLAAKEITIEIMRDECPLFRGWVDSLVALGR